MTEKQKIERDIKKEVKRLQALFSDIPESQGLIASRLIERAAWMTVSLRRLEESMNGAPLVETYQNGADQNGMKQSAELQGYNALIKNYATVMRQLSALIPKTAGVLKDRA